MRIIEKKSIKEEFTELSEFDNLHKCFDDIIKMYKNWENHSKNVSDQEWKDYGYKSFKDAKIECKKEIVSWLNSRLEWKDYRYKSFKDAKN